MAAVNLGPWPAGMNNIAPDHALPTTKYGRTVAVRNAVNVDFDDSGKVRRRKGFSQSAVISGAHSLWSGASAGAFFVAGNVLHSFDGASSLALGAVNTAGGRLAYEEVDANVYFTGLAARGLIRGGALLPWGVEVPATPPTLAVSAGNLDPGKYFAAMTYVLADGRESGASQLTSASLGAAGGFAVVAMPVPLAAEVVKKRLYLSTADGDVLYLVMEAAPADQFAAIGSAPSGSELRTAYLSPPPLGHALTHFGGRIFIADGKTVWYTEPHDYDHVDTRENFYQFGAEVSVIAAVMDGLYVCADRTYFIPGAGGKNAEQRQVLDFGAFAGTAQRMPKSKNSIWMSERGPVVATAGGAVEVLSEDSLSPGKMEGAASLIRESDGLRQFIAVGRAAEGSSLQASSYADAEVVRKASR